MFKYLQYIFLLVITFPDISLIKIAIFFHVFAFLFEYLNLQLTSISSNF